MLNFLIKLTDTSRVVGARIDTRKRVFRMPLRIALEGLSSFFVWKKLEPAKVDRVYKGKSIKSQWRQSQTWEPVGFMDFPSKSTRNASEITLAARKHVEMHRKTLRNIADKFGSRREAIEWSNPLRTTDFENLQHFGKHLYDQMGRGLYASFQGE